MFKKSDLYVYLVLMMGTFYGIPALQLVLNYQSIMESGNQDLCYYNFLCSVPVLRIKDFNHIFSNIGYMFFGTLFLVISWIRKHKRRKQRETESEPMGLPGHFGIYYALGYALVFEGILSACYHICPTNINFQVLI